MLQQPNRETPRVPPISIPLTELNDGCHMPRLGFGVWQVPNEEVTRVVEEAIAAGYRLIDTAQGYDNEEGVGVAIRKAGLDRDELFITSKLRTRLLGYEDAQRGVEDSLARLGLDYLDLFLIHWPAPKLDRFVDAWRGLVEARRRGLVRSIGVSNFLPEHIEQIIDASGIIPAINQLETHPQYQQRDVREFHARHGIQLESYSPLGSGAVLDNSEIGRIAEKHGKSPAQVIIKWHLQEGLVVIPKSVTPERIRANLEVFDFELDADDRHDIAALDDPKNGKTGSDPAEFNDLF